MSAWLISFTAAGAEIFTVKGCRRDGRIACRIWGGSLELKHVQPFHYQSTQVLSRLHGTSNLILKREPYIASSILDYCLCCWTFELEAHANKLCLEPLKLILLGEGGEKLSSDWVPAHSTGLE